MFTFDIQEKRISALQDVFLVTGSVMVKAGAKSVTFSIGPFPHNEEGMQYLDEAVAVIESMQTVSIGEFAKHGYSRVEGFSRWFDNYEDRVQAGVGQKYLDFTAANVEHGQWPWDSVYKMHGQFEGYVVGYYDHQGIHHDVAVDQVAA